MAIGLYLINILFIYSICINFICILVCRQLVGISRLIHSANIHVPCAYITLRYVHRSGAVDCDDELLSIDNISLHECKIEDAQQILLNTDQVVKLKVRKVNLSKLRELLRLVPVYIYSVIAREGNGAISCSASTPIKRAWCGATQYLQKRRMCPKIGITPSSESIIMAASMAPT